MVAYPALPSPPHLFCEYQFSAQRGLIDLARAPARPTWLRPVLKHLAKKEIPSLPSRRCKGWICISSSCVRLVSSISEDLDAVRCRSNMEMAAQTAPRYFSFSDHFRKSLRTTHFTEYLCLNIGCKEELQNATLKYLYLYLVNFVRKDSTPVNPHPQSSKPSVNNPNVLSQ